MDTVIFVAKLSEVSKTAEYPITITTQELQINFQVPTTTSSNNPPTSFCFKTMSGALVESILKPTFFVGYLAALTYMVKNRTLALLRSRSGTLSRVWSSFVVFSLAHHLVKLISFARSYLRNSFAWRNLPGDFLHIDGRELVKNLDRL